MISETKAGPAPPFESAEELHDVHERLLEAQDDQLGADSNAAMEAEGLVRLEPQVREFVERGAATGAYIEEITERTACQTLVDYWASNLARAGVPIGRVRLAQFDSAHLPILPDEPCPYVGLETFREADQSVFFGRDEAIEKVLTHLRAAPLVVISGASGSGKSSLVLAGVLPRLEKQGGTPRLVIVPSFVPGTAVLEHLASSVRHNSGSNSAIIAADVKAFRSDPQHLYRMVGGKDAPPTLIVIDQFEEVFTLSDEVDREALVANLARFLEGERHHRLILTVRAEFEARMKEQVLPSLQCKQAWYAIPEMDYEGLRSAIVKPAEVVNLHFKPEVVEHLVRRVIHQPAALPLLQFALRALWERRDRNRITQEVYAKIGGDPLVALANTAKAFLEEHKDPQTLDEIKRILLELVRVDERLEAYRQPVARSGLLATGRANTMEVLQLLERADFVRITPGLGGQDAVVEVKHESLVRNWPELVTWIGEKRDRYRQRLGLTDAAANWKRLGKPADDGLLTGSLLADAAKQPDLSELEQEYVRASEEAADKARRELKRTNEMLARRLRLAWSLSFVVVALLSAVAFAGWLLVQQKDRLREAELTDMQQKDRLREAALTDMQQKDRLREAALTDMQQKDRLREAALTDMQQKDQLREAAMQQNDELRKAALTLRNLEAARLSDVQVDLLNGVEIARRIEMSGQGEERADQFRYLIGPLGRNPQVLSVFSGHNEPVRAVKFDPVHSVIASASEDGTISLRDYETGRMWRPPWKAHDGAIYALAFTPNGDKLASAGDTNVKLWDVVSGKEDPPLNHDSNVNAVAIDPKGGNLMAVGCADGTVVLWDLARRSHITLRHSDQATDTAGRAVYSVAFSSDGKLLASGGSDGRIVLWNVAARTQKGTAMEAYEGVFAIAVSHDGRTIASGHAQGHVYLWSTETGKWIRTLTSHERGVYGVVFSPDDTRLATTSSDRRVQLHTLPSHPKATAKSGIGPEFTKAQQLSGVGGRRFYGVDFVKNNKLATGTDTGDIVIWNTAEKPWPRFARYIADRKEHTGAAFTGDGTMLVLYSQDSLTVRPVEAPDPADASRPEVERQVKANQKGVNFVYAVGYGKNLLTVGRDNSIKQWEWDAIKQQYKAETLVPSGKDEITAAAYTAKTQTLVFATYNAQHETTIWRAGLTGDNPEPILDAKLRISLLSIAPNADLLVAIYSDESQHGAELWRLDPITLVTSFTDHEISAVFSPDGKRLASGDRDGYVSLWDTQTLLTEPEVEPVSLDAHIKSVTSLAFSPDGSKLASGSVDSTVILWDVATGHQLSAPMDVYYGDRVEVLFDPGGRFLATSAFQEGDKEEPGDGLVVLWEISVPTLLYRACEAAGRNMTPAEWRSFFGGEPYRITCPGATADEADTLALTGDKDKESAQTKFAAAWNAVLEMSELGQLPQLANHICWTGSINGFAIAVQAACDKAVEWADPAIRDLYRDSRGLARALTGDKPGAIDDFESVVAYLNKEPGRGGYSKAFIRSREEWIGALRKGDDPFDAKLLKALRTEVGR